MSPTRDVRNPVPQRRLRHRPLPQPADVGDLEIHDLRADLTVFLLQSAGTSVFARPLKEADLPPIRLHDLRHGAATLAVAGGANPKVVANAPAATALSCASPACCVVASASACAGAGLLAGGVEFRRRSGLLRRLDRVDRPSSGSSACSAARTARRASQLPDQPCRLFPDVHPRHLPPRQAHLAPTSSSSSPAPDSAVAVLILSGSSPDRSGVTLLVGPCDQQSRAACSDRRATGVRLRWTTPAQSPLGKSSTGADHAEPPANVAVHHLFGGRLQLRSPGRPGGGRPAAVGSPRLSPHRPASDRRGAAAPAGALGQDRQRGRGAAAGRAELR